jgi:SAM-dependent methyltransferase
MNSVEYYDRHAERFYQETLHIDMGELYSPFLELIPKGGKILDAGCGSGRDSHYFLNQRYDITAFDASEALANLSSKLLNQKVLNTTFQKLEYENEFDGVWACASLIHVARQEMSGVLMRLTKALKRGGILFASFKYGNGEYQSEGRQFNNYDESSIKVLLSNHTELTWKRLWISLDKRRDRQNEKWLNLLLQKRDAL